MRNVNTKTTWGILLGILCSCLGVITPGYAQSPQAGARKVTGKIIDKVSGVAVQGATLSVKGTSRTVATNTDGAFTINAVPGETLLITAIGYSTQQVKVGASGPIELFLDKDFSKLDEVVVIGYGTAKKKDVVGALDIVAAKDAGSTTSTNPSQLLIGKSAGVQIVQSNGTPGADAQILIRGTGSFTSVDPLYVIDGIQGDKNLFNALSAQDIENITILKDASSTAIYGSSGANGVVIITTRRGKAGPPKISITSQWGVAKAWKQLDLLNAAQYIGLLKDFAATSNTALPAKFNTPSVLVDSNNWQKQIFRPALVSENDISISGGSERVAYNFSLGYISQQSIVKSLTNDRINARFSLDETLGRFRLGQSLSIRYTHTTGKMANITDGIEYAPYKPIHDPTVLGGYSILTNTTDFSNVNNPLQAVNLVHPVTNEFVFFPQLYGEVNLISGLKFRSQFSAEIGGGKTTTYQYPFTASNDLANPREAILGYNDYSFYTLENYFSYNKTFGKHSVSAIAGNSYIDPGTSSAVTATGTSIPNDNVQNIAVAQSQAVTSSSYDYAHASLISYYGRLIYSYADKYILSASFRRDGASNFGPENRFGNFPGLGAAWKFTEESFTKSMTFLSSGKLRVGWGRTGNNSIPTTGITSVQTFSGNPSGNLVYSLGTSEAFNNGTTIATLANPAIKWETTNQTDIGLDLGFLNDRLNATIDLYNRKSSGLLVQVPVPASTGASLSGIQPVEFANAADAQNRGIELSLGYHSNISRDFSFNISGNIAYNQNKVLSLGSKFTAPIQDGSFQNLSTFTYTAAGSPIGAFYGYKVDHVAKDQAEIDALNAGAAKATGNSGAVYQAGLLPGDFIYKDLNHSGVVTDSDQVILGSPIPKFIYGFNAGINYKNFDLNIVVSGITGLKILNGLKFFTSTEATGHNTTTSLLGRWRNSGDVASLPRAGQDATATGNLRASDWWLESGAYLRLRNLTIGYSLPKQVLNSFGSSHVFTRIRFYVAAQNLFTITKYTGYDPELSTQSGLNTTIHPSYVFTRGIDDGSLPQPRTFIGGVQFGF